MMQGLIQRIVRHRVEKRSDACLPTAWIEVSSKQHMWKDGVWLTSTPRPTIPSLDVPVLAMLGQGSKDRFAELLDLAGAGSRVYALVGPEWGKDQACDQLGQAPRVLVRRLSEVPCTAVHFGTEARIWIGGGFILRLDSTQAEALRQNFLRLFWHEATEEAWPVDRQFVWRPAFERPFDVPLVPTSALVRIELTESCLIGNPLGALIHMAAGLPPDSAPKRLWYPVGPNHHEGLAKLTQAGTQVLWADRGLPDILVNGNTGEVLLPGKLGRLRLRLTANQTTEVAQLLTTPPAWQFQTDVRLGETKHRLAQFWLPDEPAPRAPEDEQLIEVPDVLATSLGEAPSTKPTSVPPPQPLALTVRYQWTVVPPRVPAGTEEDPLVGRWRKLDEDWISRLSQVRNGLHTVDGDQGRVGRVFSHLVSAMLGFKRKHDDLLERVGALEAQRPSAVGPSSALDLLAELVELEDAAAKLHTHLEDTERQAREEEEIKKQQGEWQSRVDAANSALPVRREALATAKERLSAIEAELVRVEKLRNSSDKETRKDLKANKNKLIDEQRRAEKEIKRLRDEIASLEQRATEQFVFHQSPAPMARPTNSGGRFVPPASKAPPNNNVPEEALPEVGFLKRHKGQRYLVIKNWEDVALGEQAASRLSARLVAPEDL